MVYKLLILAEFYYLCIVFVTKRLQEKHKIYEGSNL